MQFAKMCFLHNSAFLHLGAQNSFLGPMTQKLVGVGAQRSNNAEKCKKYQNALLEPKGSFHAKELDSARFPLFGNLVIRDIHMGLL